MPTTVPFNYSPPECDLDIIYQDNELLVLNKASGLLTVPGKQPSHKDSLALRVQQQFPDALIVHRLDMATSGLIIMALSKQIHRSLSIMFQQREVEKHYEAVVDGLIEQSSGTINEPLITDWPNRPRQKIDYELGKPSVTHYRVISRDTDALTTRVELMPVTGRSHQLRVHLQSIGHCILGDQLYAEPVAKAAADRLLLHASKLQLLHPTSHKPLTFNSPAPF